MIFAPISTPTSSSNV
ncbi:hypothetical protein D021_2412A, partial [Vibrio parahaemolyticus 10296]